MTCVVDGRWLMARRVSERQEHWQLQGSGESGSYLGIGIERMYVQTVISISISLVWHLSVS